MVHEAKFRPMPLVFFCLTLLLLWPVTEKTAWGNDFTADISASILNNNLSGTIYVTDGRYRIDFKTREGQMETGPIIIVDRSEGNTLLLNQDDKTYQAVENFSFQAHMIDPFQAVTYLERNVEKRSAGTDEISGYACDHQEFYDHDFKLADVWFAQGLNAFPLKAHIVSGRDDGAVKARTNIGDTRLELSNIREAPVPSSVFQVPREFSTKARPEEAGKERRATAQILEGVAPWGRRINMGGEMRVRVDSQRPIRITLKNLDKNESAACTYATFLKGDLETPAGSKQVTITKDWPREKKIPIDKNEPIARLSIRVDEGLVYAKISYERGPFVSTGDEKFIDGYLTEKEGQGFQVDPARKLAISVTGDSQDSPESEVTIVCYRDDYKDKVFEKTALIENEKTETWEFAPDRKIKTCEVSVGNIGGIKYRAEQPSPGKPESEAAVLTKEHYEELLKAFRSGDAASVQKRLDSGLNPNALAMGEPLLLRAAQFGNAEVVKLLLDRGGDIHSKDARGGDALIKAQNNFKHFQEVIPVLVEAGFDVNPDTSIAILANKVKSGTFMPGVKETIGYLISKGVDINAPITQDGHPPLLVAAQKAWLEPVEFYLDHGADINAQDDKGNTALSLAKVERPNEMPYLKKNRKIIIEILESRGAR
jgi:hypothetical protein